MSTTELSKAYEPAAVEAEANRVWLEEKCFLAAPAKPGEPYSIVIPPPNVTGALHLGHAINNTLQDILTRKARMEGKKALWVPGLDHAHSHTEGGGEKTRKGEQKHAPPRHRPRGAGPANLGLEATVRRP